MVMAYKIKAHQREHIAAVTHNDGTGRLQTVEKDVNPLYWKLIKRFSEISGVPVLLNTSFNENEPIVDTPHQALDCFLRTQMDVLVMGPFLMLKSENEASKSNRRAFAEEGGVEGGLKGTDSQPGVLSRCRIYRAARRRSGGSFGRERPPGKRHLQFARLRRPEPDVFPRREREQWKGIDISRVPTLGLGKRSKWRRAVDFAYFLLRCAARLATAPRYDAVIITIAAEAKPSADFIHGYAVRAVEGRAAGLLGDGSESRRGHRRRLAARRFRHVAHVAMDAATDLAPLRKGDRPRPFHAYPLANPGRADPATVEVIPPWSHDDALRYDAQGRDAFRARHGLEGKFVVMYSGNHSPCHPLDTLMEAALRLADRPEVAFCFVGGGSEHARVKAFAAARRLSNIVCLPYQPIEQLSASLAAADLHAVVMGDALVGIIHPCKIYNAMLLGIPILYIGPAQGHIPDLAPPQAHGTWFYSAAHGAVDLTVSQILAASSRRAVNNPEQIRIASAFSSGILIDKIVKSLDATVSAPLWESYTSAVKQRIGSDN